MSRGLSTQFKAYLATGKIRAIQLAEMTFDSGTVYMTSASRDITWNGNVYVKAAGLLSFNEVSETLNLEANTSEIKLSGITDTAKSLFTSGLYTYVGNSVKRYTALCTEDWEIDTSIPDNPFLVFEGDVDSMSFTDSFSAGTAEVSLPIINHWARFNDRHGRRTNPEEHRALFPNDSCVDQVPELVQGAFQLKF